MWQTADREIIFFINKGREYNFSQLQAWVLAFEIMQVAAAMSIKSFLWRNNM